MKIIISVLVGIFVALIATLLILVGITTIKSKEAETPETIPEEEVGKVNIPSKEEIGNNPIATIEIEGMEPMQFVLFPDKAPQSVENFISLANSGFYDGLSMHRIVSGFVAQGGDPTGTGAGGPGYSIKGEFPSNGVITGLTHQKGALAWARSGSYDSAGSQFYICLDDATYLDSKYAVFGYMIDGEEALEQLELVSSSEGTPTEEVKIKSVSVDTKGVEYDEPEKLKEDAEIVT